MSLSRVSFKAEGLEALKRYLLVERERVTKAELARRIGVDRATIGRWIETMIAVGIPVEHDERRRVYIDRSRYFTHLSLTRDESVILMLALRLLQQYLDKPNRHGVEMLHKLGLAFQQGIAPEVGTYVQEMADEQRRDLTSRHMQSDHQRLLELVGEAWIEGRKLQLRYKPLHAKQAFEDVLHPYLLEPSAIGRSTYVIGYSEQAGAMRVYKIERIEGRPLPLDDRFDAPDHLDVRRLLTGAWGIWFRRDEQPTRVKLRFSAQVTRRVTETRWHPSEQTELDDQGGLVWTAEIDAVQEMLPWIRGWGADCEVLEPEDLREKVKGEVRRQMRMYGIADTDANNRQQRFDDIFGG
ncbi:MAG: helix-turn-helix transcriptional regulator [Chloroflexaceae bacterium]